MQFSEYQQGLLAEARGAAQALANATGFPVYVVVDQGPPAASEDRDREADLAGCACLLCLLDL